MTIDISNSGVSEEFDVRVELQENATTKETIYEAKHKKSDDRIQVKVNKNATGLIKVYIDNDLEKEMIL